MIAQDGQGLTAVIKREACGNAVRVMIIGGFAQSLDHVNRFVVGYVVAH
jgi:hypothetical protein